MPDYTALCAEWQEMLARRRAMGESLSLWTSVLDGWRDWKDGGVAPLTWSAEECLERWERGAALLGEATPTIAPESLEDLLASSFGTHDRVLHREKCLERKALRPQRMTGTHRDTIMRLLVEVGAGCAQLMDEQMRDLPCRRAAARNRPTSSRSRASPRHSIASIRSASRSLSTYELAVSVPSPLAGEGNSVMSEHSNG